MKGSKSIEDRERILNSVDKVYCVSNYIRNRFIQGIKKDISKVVVLYNGIDDKKFYFIPESRYSKFQIGCIANFWDIKDQMSLIKSVEFLRDSHQITDIEIEFIGSGKNVFVPETLNKHKFIVPNWRVFDTIYWVAQRTIRKKQSTGKGYQNGFAFYENGMGFHFKSVDKMIDDINAQTPSKTDPKTGKCCLYTYEYSPKGIDEGASDPFKIKKVVFPNERNFLNGLRHGTWSGYSIGFDPVTITSSIMGTSTDMSVDAYRYSLEESWKNMSHIGKNTKNPFSKADKEVKNLVNYPKRVRYTMLPNQNFDPNFFNKLVPQKSKNYEALVELQAYQWMRFESLKTIKLQIEVPGNLDLYVGSGVNIVIPNNFVSGGKTEIDKKYSGRYMIAALTHKTTGLKLLTEMFLVKDSVLK